MSPAGRDRVSGYAAAHRRVRGVRGPAVEQPCAECGAAARRWCYDGADPDELRDPVSGRRYSLDPGRYRARCASCHRAMAAGHRPLAPDAVERAAALYEAGASLDQVAARLRVTRPTLRTALAAHGVALRERAVAVDGDQAVALYQGGASVRQVAVRLGVARAAVRAALVANGVSIRPPGPTLRTALAARGVALRERAVAVDGEQVVALYQGGASVRQVAARLGVSRPAVRAALDAGGVPLRGRSVTVDAVRAARLYEAGASLRGIAVLLDVPPRAVRAVLVANGVSIRPPGPTRRHLHRAATGPDASQAADPTAAPTEAPTARSPRPRITFRPLPTTSRQPANHPETFTHPTAPP